MEKIKMSNFGIATPEISPYYPQHELKVRIDGVEDIILDNTPFCFEVKLIR
ncbi:hypothetical protein MHTCC0001_34120 [Flavobacteriaceae bacterium MHTCC 0001]